MDISLSSDFDNFVNEQLATGLYNSVSDIVNEAMKLFASKNSTNLTIEKLNHDIEKGIEDYKMGRFQDGEEFFKELMS